MADAHLPLDPAEMPGMADWRRLVDKALNGRDFSILQSRTRDGILVEPLYAPRHDTAPLAGRGPRPWAILQLVDDPDPERANAQALADLEGGATGLALRFAGANTAPGVGLPPTEEALLLALEGVDLAAVQLRIEAHPQAVAMAAWLRDLVARQGIAPELTGIAWGLEPIACLLADGAPGKVGAQDLAGAFHDLFRAGFRGALAEVDGRMVHAAGGSEAQELAAVLAGAVWWLRALGDGGTSPEAALAHFGASLSADHDQFLSTAKLRAMRILWARLTELCGAAGAELRIHAETSRRMLTRADPHTNLVRTTIAAFAAATGGADSLATLPFDAALGLSSGEARALARNVHHLLREESHLYRVADPGAGSGAIEALTEGLCEAGWAEFQELEREGGIVESLRAGAFQARIAAMREALQADVASGAVPLVGATVFRAADTGPAPEGDAPAKGAAVAGLAPVSLEDMVRAAA